MRPAALVPINPAPAVPVAPAPTEPAALVREAQTLVASGERGRLVALVTVASRPLALEADLEQLRRYVGATPPLGEAEIRGPRAVVRLERRPDAPVVVLVREAGAWRLDFRTTAAWHEAAPGPEDPQNQPIALADAVAGIPGAGDLVATLETSIGALRCRLFEARAPATVANFVALARGLRGFVDPKTGAWVRRLFYDDLVFHRVIVGTLAQTGDPRASGRGGPGYELADELDESSRFDRPGVLAMANRGPNTNGSQFFVTARALPELDGLHSVFGVCDPVALVERLTGGPVGEGGAPLEPVRIVRVTFARGD